MKILKKKRYEKLAVRKVDLSRDDVEEQIISKVE